MPDPSTIGWLPWLQAFGPAAGMVVILFVLQARGHLVPKRLHDEVRHDRDTYRLAAETALQAATKAANNTDTLAVTVATLVKNSEEQLGLSRQILSHVSGPAPTDRSVA
jgi:hypothetical protein